MKKNPIKKAFTLVEMLIVIVIIGILAAALIPRLQGMQSRARDTARKADLSQIGTALAAFNADNGRFPATAGSINGALAASLGPYLLSIPSDPNKARTFDGIVTPTNPTCIPDPSGSGSYMYTPLKRRGIDNQSFVLMAGTEEGGSSSNWVLDSSFGTDGCITNAMDVSAITAARCDTIGDGPSNLSGCVASVSEDHRRYIYAQ